MIAVAMYAAKVLVMVALMAWVAWATPRTPYRLWIVLGLAWSLAGDVFLMLPGDHFVPGLAAFLVAHLCYITAFARDGGGLKAWGKAGVFAAFAAYMLWRLWPALGDLRVPVVAYTLVIGTMAWQAAARAETHARRDAALAAIGAIVFMLSDSLLAFNRFLGPNAVAAALVLPTYWVAQVLIARSAVSAAPTRTPAPG